MKESFWEEFKRVFLDYMKTCALIVGISLLGLLILTPIVLLLVD